MALRSLTLPPVFSCEVASVWSLTGAPVSPNISAVVPFRETTLLSKVTSAELTDVKL